MESLLFVIDAIVIVAVIFSSVKNDKLRAGMPQAGFFRFKAAAEAPADLPKKPGRVRR